MMGQAGATVELVILQLREHTEALGIALEVEEVRPLRIRHVVQPTASRSLLKPAANGILPGVAEWRVADVMGEAGRLDDHAEVGRAAPLGQVIAKDFADAHAE